MLDQSKEIKVCTYLGLTTLILSVALVGCGGGSSSGGSSNTPKPSEPTPEVMTDITLKTLSKCAMFNSRYMIIPTIVF